MRKERLDGKLLFRIHGEDDQPVPVMPDVEDQLANITPAMSSTFFPGIFLAVYLVAPRPEPSFGR
jgi:hypothetical protein